MPNWITDIQYWFTEYWPFVAAGVTLIADIVGAIEMSKIAYAKGYSRGKYFIICFLFTLLGYLIVVALPDIEMAERDEDTLEVMKQISVKLTRANARLKKLNAAAPAKQVPEAVRRLASPAAAAASTGTAKSSEAAPASRTHDAVATESEKAERRSLFAAVDAPTEAISILETAIEFETDAGLQSYLNRKYEKADNTTKAVLDPLMHISEERIRNASERLLNQIRR